MSFLEEIYDDGADPIDMVEHLAALHEWEINRLSDDQISMGIEGQWREYVVSLAWSPFDETLRLLNTFEIDPPARKLPALYELLNLLNEQCWMGSFTYCSERKRIMYRYALTLRGGQTVGSEQIDAIIAESIGACECYYPALQLLVWGDQTPEEAMQVAIAQGYGRA